MKEQLLKMSYKYSITNTNSDDRNITLDILGSVLELVRISNKTYIDNIDNVFYNVTVYPNDMIYFTRHNLYISERSLGNVIAEDTYIEIEDMVNILKNARVKLKPILNEDFYKELNVNTPIGTTKVDCLVFDKLAIYRVVKELCNNPKE